MNTTDKIFIHNLLNRRGRRTLNLREVFVRTGSPEAPPAVPATFEDIETGFSHFRKIRNAIPGILSITDPEALPLQESQLMCKRGFDHDSLRFKLLRDAVSVLWTSEGWLEQLSHRFVFPYAGLINETTYHQESYNANIQLVPSRPVNLRGIVEIVEHPEAREHLEMVSTQIDEITQIGWNLATHQQQVRGLARC